MKIILCSSKHYDWFKEYIEKENLEKLNFITVFGYGNTYFENIKNNIEETFENNSNYFIHTFSKEVLEVFSKYLIDKEIDFKFVRLYYKNDKLCTVEYNKKEFIENIDEGWELR